MEERRSRRRPSSARLVQITRGYWGSAELEVSTEGVGGTASENRGQASASQEVWVTDRREGDARPLVRVETVDSETPA